MATRLKITSSKSRRRGEFVLGSVVLSGAIIFASLSLSRYMNSQKVPASLPSIVAEFDTVKVPVPSNVVPAGTRVKDIAFRTVAYPKHQIPEGTLVDITSAKEAVTLTALPANLPLFQKNLSLTAHLSNPVLERIPLGMRAITVRVDATSALEVWAGSGSVVDVLLIEKDRTTVVAEKVKILSAERSVSPVEGAASPSVPSTVTLLVTQEHCLAINTAIPLGRIAFALRSTQDEDHWASTVYTREKLKGAPPRKEERNTVTGFASVHGTNEVKNFALSNGRWVKAEVMPEGFFVGER